MSKIDQHIEKQLKWLNHLGNRFKKHSSRSVKKALADPIASNLRLLACSLIDLAEYWGTKSLEETQGGNLDKASDYFFDSIAMHKKGIEAITRCPQNWKPPHEAISVCGNLFFYFLATGQHNLIKKNTITWFEEAILSHANATANPISLETRFWERFALDLLEQEVGWQIQPSLVDITQQLYDPEAKSLDELQAYHLTRLEETDFKGPYPQFMQSPFDLYAMEILYLENLKELTGSTELTSRFQIPKKNSPRVAPPNKLLAQVEKLDLTQFSTVTDARE